MNIYFEILGYFASIIVAVSLMMNSQIWLRWINLLGAILFSTYGFLISSYPVGVLNAIIAVTNIYFLIKMYFSKEYFTLLEMPKNDVYFSKFLEFHKNNIRFFFPDFEFNQSENTLRFYVLRNMVTAGVFIGKMIDKETLMIELDYVIPEYMDFKTGKYIYEQHKTYFLNKGIKKLAERTTNPKHEKYLSKMGFHKIDNENQKDMFVKVLEI